MKTNEIELDQGVDHKGRTLGYDHKRKNFITWDLADDKIVVVKVEHDDQETGHGSIAATTREAKAVAAAENRKTNSSLRRAIAQKFARA